jgi:hypothetical protein
LGISFLPVFGATFIGLVNHTVSVIVSVDRVPVFARESGLMGQISNGSPGSRKYRAAFSPLSLMICKKIKQLVRYYLRGIAYVYYMDILIK